MSELSKNVKNILSNSTIVLLFLFIAIRITSFISDRYTTSLTLIATCILLVLLSIKFIRNKKLVLLFTSVLLSISIIEIILLYTSPYRSYIERNGGYSYVSPYHQEKMDVFEFNKKNKVIKSRTLEYNYSFTTNNLGLRDYNEITEQIKIFLVGDSFIQGVGVEDNHRIDVQVEKIIPCEKCVLNLGVSGSDLFISYKAMDSLFKKNITPKLVVLNINSSDIVDVITRHIEIAKKSMFFDFMYGSSFIFRHIVHSFNDLDFLFLNKEKRKIFEDVALKKMEEKLIDYKILLAKKGISFLVVLQPMESELNKQKYILSPLLDFGKQKGIIVFDAKEKLSLLSEDKSLYWPIDGHFNKDGTQAFAEILTAEIAFYFPSIYNSIIK